jgi:Arc/MetJ-type ribon-helix-helix transcriptional regulator
MRNVTFRLSDHELATIDELRPAKVSRSEFVRRLLRHAEPYSDELTHEESMRLLADSARAGSVPAQIALERALRATAKKEDEVGDAIERLLAPQG